MRLLWTPVIAMALVCVGCDSTSDTGSRPPRTFHLRDVEITMERIQPGGSPSYTVSIMGDGSLSFVGLGYTDDPMVRSTVIDTNSVIALLGRFYRYGFFEMDDSYDQHPRLTRKGNAWGDTSTSSHERGVTTLSVRIAEYEKSVRVEDRDGPMTFLQLALRINRKLQAQGWVIPPEIPGWQEWYLTPR